MKKLLFLFSIINLLSFSCTKENDYAEFNLKVSSFTTQVTPFKGSDPFLSFIHLYPTNTDVIFTNLNGIEYQFNTGNLTIETFKFGLPVGTYKITGSGIWTSETNSVMSYTIPEQTLTITSETTIIPMTLTPTCFLILVADPESLLDETTKPRIYNYINTYHKTYPYGTYSLLNVNMSLSYIYAMPCSESVFQIFKKDKSLLSCETSTCFKIGYLYKILITSSGTGSIINPTFKETNTLNF